MIIIFIRALVLFFVLFLSMRLMGKRQIGEMEPFELVITLVISELACIPMSDRSIPITFGVVAILTMFLVHQLVLLLSKNSKMQSVINGKPVMVLTKNGVDVQALKKLNMQVTDILQAMRVSQVFSLEEVTYGIMETNGQLTIVANKQMQNKQQTLPVCYILDGQWQTDQLKEGRFTKQQLQQILKQKKAKVADVVVLAIDENNRLTFQTTHKPIVFENLGDVV